MRSLPLLCVVVLVAAVDCQAQEKTRPATRISWKKVVLDTKFRSEGVAVADVDKDGKKDILIGDLWYSAPDWKPHVIRKDRVFDPANYSQTMCVFADDIDGDGWVDQVVVGFPGDPCYWYKNPGKSGGPWKEYRIQDSACNESPQYVDLFGSGKRGLLCAHKGEMCFFQPGPDPTQPWNRLSISGPGKNMPGTQVFSHGLGAQDLNGDGKLDVLCNEGWWEQPAENATQGKWAFHPYRIPLCSDIYAVDLDGDGKADLVSSSAHETGFWWHQQKAGKEHPTFLTRNLFPRPVDVARKPVAGVKLEPEETEMLAALAKARTDQKHVPWRGNADLIADARRKDDSANRQYPGKIVAEFRADLAAKSAADIASEFLAKFPKARDAYLEVGVGVHGKQVTLLVGDRGGFALPGEMHALNYVDIDGDGLKDFVTGRRHWSHHLRGDDFPADPAYLYWFKASKDKTGQTTFTPMLIDDDSGVGTQFAVEDVDGDGLLDVVIANKKGVFLFLQVREEIVEPGPARTKD